MSNTSIPPVPLTLEGENSALFTILGHKGDLMLIHFRDNFPALEQAERAVGKLQLNQYVVQTKSGN